MYCLLGRIRFAKSGFRFIVNPDLDSLANRMVWICDVVRSDVIVIQFIYVYDTDVTSSFAGESTSKLDSLDLRIRICSLNGRIH